MIILDDHYDLSNWFHVKFDQDKISITVKPPSNDGWDAEILWDEIIRVCFKPGDFLESDEIYIFIKKRPESFVIPIEANGGLEVWNQIIEQGLFDAALAIEAATALEGIFCWPTE